MFCFEILRIYGGNRKKRKIGKSGPKRAPTLQRREPTPWRRPTSRCCIPRRSEAKVPKWRTGVTLLRCCVATVHRGKNFGFLF